MDCVIITLAVNRPTDCVVITLALAGNRPTDYVVITLAGYPSYGLCDNYTSGKPSYGLWGN